MYTLHLHDLRFYAYHGLYKEEKILGNIFTVHVDVVVDLSGPVRDISDTTDYTNLYRIIKQYMAKPSDILETLAANMADALALSDNRVKKVRITIIKGNPPVENFEGSIGLSFEKEW